MNGIEVSVADHGRRRPTTRCCSSTASPVGPPIGTAWSTTWRPARRVLTLEHRGHGHSTNTGDAPTYTFDQLVLDLTAVVDALDLDRFDLLGHSMGGTAATRYALAHPERLRRWC